MKLEMMVAIRVVVAAGESPTNCWLKASTARCTTNSSTAPRSPAFDRRRCCTRPGDACAARATSRIEVAATPRAANSRSAASRMRATAVRSESALAIRLYCMPFDCIVRTGPGLLRDACPGAKTEVHMAEATRRRLDAATGMAFVVLMTLALALPGQPLRAEDSIEHITAVLVDHRVQFLVGGYVAGLAAMAYLWFLGSVRDFLRQGGAEDATSVAAAGGVFAITVLLLGMAMFSGVAFVAAGLGHPALVRAFTDTGNPLIQ